MQNLAVFCDVQRLLPAYDPGLRHFSLNLSVAVEKGSVAVGDLAYLTPWTWTIDSFRCYGVKGDVVSATEIHAEPVGPTKVQADGWVKALESVCNRFKDDDPALTRFGWGGALQAAEGSKAPWYASLMQASNFPGELPYAANLAFLLRVETEAVFFNGNPRYDEVIAAPAFRFEQAGDLFTPGKVSVDLIVTGSSNPIAFAPLGASGGSGPRFYRWAFDTTSTSAAVNGYQRECLLQPEIKKRFLRINTGWVSTPEDEPGHKHFTGEDWTVRLESRLEDAFDLSQRLIDLIRRRGQRNRTGYRLRERR